MKFNKLRIAGFKTFVDPTEVLIEPGLTAVVGPNGCGKSNLVEALRWVMGESSHKSLRASGMDDVIFSGNGNRPARNMAEVTVTLDNSDRRAPAPFNDDDTLEISRRIEREAGSSYRINGKDARARDVQLMFADASTGAHSPSMVRQGQIGELISAKPQARRKILEEAAGISGLHSRRHEAELRLRAAEQNLERINDVLGEIEHRLEALKKQARQAKRYRQMSAEIRRIEAVLLHLRWLEAQAQVQQRREALNAINAKLGEQSTELARIETARADKAASLPQLREDEAAKAAALRHHMVNRDGLDAELQRVKGRQEELQQRITQAHDDSARETQSISGIDETLQSLAQEQETLNREIEEAAQLAGSLAQACAQADATLQAAENELSTHNDERSALVAQRQQCERTAREETQRFERLSSQLADVERDIGALQNEKRDHGLEALEASIGTLRSAVEAADGQVGESEQALKLAQEKETAAVAPVREAESALHALEGERNALNRLLDDGSGLWPPVIASISASPGYEIALGAAIGDDLENPDDSAAPVYWSAKATSSASDPALPDGTEPLAAHVKAPEHLARRIAQIGIVADVETGERLQSQLQTGQRLVTLEGHVWRWDGLVRSAQAKGSAASRLEQRNRLDELNGAIRDAQSNIESLKDQVQEARDEVSSAKQTDEAARLALREARSKLDQQQSALAAAQREAAQDTAKLSALSEAQVRLKHSAEEAREARDAAQVTLNGLRDDSELISHIEKLRTKVLEARAASAQARAAHDGHGNELSARRRRLEEIGRDESRWKKQKEGAAEQIARQKQRSEELKAELESLSGRPGEIESQRASIAEQIAQAEQARQASSDALALAETNLAETEKALKAAQEAAGQTREEKARGEAVLENAGQRMAELKATIEEALECAPEQILQTCGIEPDDAENDADRLEAKLERLKGDRERLGGVNLRAEEEATEEQERYDALDKERGDLEEAVARLRGAISSLNQEGRERLVAAFETVNGHFQALFTKLFNGGEAELRFTESDDPLEAGLEIFARPPGKRPTTLTLLSGGEQALTAIALIFAVFLTNPAPICVLDEVDAPLDDANVERFCTLLEEMAGATETRFFTITHNPITMSRMNRLYGVTMAERGVSQLVSVDLMGAERLREAV